MRVSLCLYSMPRLFSEWSNTKAWTWNNHGRPQSCKLPNTTVPVHIRRNRYVRIPRSPARRLDLPSYFEARIKNTQLLFFFSISQLVFPTNSPLSTVLKQPTIRNVRWNFCTVFSATSLPFLNFYIAAPIRFQRLSFFSGVKNHRRKHVLFLKSPFVIVRFK